MVICNCGKRMHRDWRTDIPMIDTSMCRDHNHVPVGKRVARNANGMSQRQAAKEEKKFDDHIRERRSLLADGGNKGSFRHTHSVPADLYHGKIKETGDKDYWRDSTNMRKHKDCKVD